MIAVLFDHFAQLLARKRLHLRIGELTGVELPHRDLRNEQDAVAIGVVKNERTLLDGQ